MSNYCYISPSIEIAALAAQVVTVDTVVDAIRAVDLPAINVNINANETKIDIIDTVVDAIRATDVPVLAALLVKERINAVTSACRLDNATVNYEDVLNLTGRAGIIKAIYCTASGGAMAWVTVRVDGGALWSTAIAAGATKTVKLSEDPAGTEVVVEGGNTSNFVLNLKFHDSVHIQFKSGEAVQSQCKVIYDLYDV